MVRSVAWWGSLLLLVSLFRLLLPKGRLPGALGWAFFGSCFLKQLIEGGHLFKGRGSVLLSSQSRSFPLYPTLCRFQSPQKPHV